MATYVPAKYATAYVTYISVASVAAPLLAQTNPTIAVGDFKVSKDGGALANLTTLPAVTPAGGKMVKISLSATEMTADNVTLVCSDAAGGEWGDVIINIPTAVSQIDDLATAANLSTLDDAVGNLSTSSAGISTVATSFTKAGTEVETLTYTATQQVNLSYHQVAPGAGSTDVYYQFDVGSEGVPTQVEWVGYVQSAGDIYGVYFYNWGAASWDQVASLSGAAVTTPRTETWIATTAHVGTGANDGLVRLRFQSSGATSGTNVATDRILCTYAVIASTGLITSGVAQAGAATSITLATAASSTNGTYDPAIVRIVSGTGSGQARLILDYVGSTRVATIDRNWRTNPDSTSFYEVVSSPNLVSRNEGIAAGGASTSITLNASASAVNDAYVGQTIWLVAGTGQDQARIVTAYNGTSKIATVSVAWTTTPDTSSIYMMLPQGRADVVSFTTSALAQINAEVDTALTDYDGPTNAELATALGTADDATLAAIAAEAVKTAAIKAKTDNLPSDPADASDIAARFTTLDTAVDALPTNAELATALGTADDATLAAIAAEAVKTAAIKAKTDSLTFTVSGQLDTNLQYVNDVQVNGTGATGNEWGP